ncbi:4896_t:CDS:2 [Acaulospora colombiana]|uniref:4896_t:CDS:1 n=1 Tax=Acaulospora colombiana TaxID=27376 RepID=A0ACA9L7Z3_9GLOM|nr:4896_t:CDS:2 [Acaulospora colombiana]
MITKYSTVSPKPQTEFLLQNGIRVLMYNGDADYIVNWFGGNRTASALEWSHQSEFDAVPLTGWCNNAKAVGQVRSFGALWFVRMYNSGHSVPYYQPANSLEMFANWINNQSLPTNVCRSSSSSAKKIGNEKSDGEVISNEQGHDEPNRAPVDETNHPSRNLNPPDVTKPREITKVDDDFVNFDALRETLTRVFQQPCGSILRIDKNPSSQIPYLVNMEDGSKYVVRISCPSSTNQTHNYSEKYATKRLESEASLIGYVSSCTNIPVPIFHHWNAKKDNVVGSEFVIMDYLRGVPLLDEWTNLTFEEKQEVLLQIIDILTTLRELEFPMIGSLFIEDCEAIIGECVFHAFMQSGRDGTEDAYFGPFFSTRDLLQAALNNELKFIKGLDNEYQQLWSPVQERLTELFFDYFENKDHDSTFVACSSELSASKILVNRDPNGGTRISGFLAWDCAGSKPLECLYKYPMWIRNDLEDVYSEERKMENLKLQEYFTRELFERDSDAKRIHDDTMRNHFITAILEEYACPWSIHERIQLLYNELGDAKYYTGVAKEKIGEAINNKNLREQGRTDRLSGTSEREAASVRDNEKEKHNDTEKKRADNIIEKADEIMKESVDNTMKERADSTNANNIEVMNETLDENAKGNKCKL